MAISAERRLARLRIETLSCYLNQFSIRVTRGRGHKVVVEASKVGAAPVCFTRSTKTKRDREATAAHAVELFGLRKRDLASLQLLLAAFR